MKRTNRALGESGLVSIVVTVVLMVVMSLIVLSFASLSRREQRQTLDRQLATQATYAAESGINDAVKALSEKAGDVTFQSKLASGQYDDDCSLFKTDADLSGDLDSGGGVSYTCVQVNIAPGDLQYKDVDTNSKVIPLQLSSGNISQLTLNWDGANGQKNCSRDSGEADTFPSASDWDCDMGLLRVDMVAINADGSIPTGSDGTTRSYLADTTATFFLSPVSGGTNTVAYGSAVGFMNQGAVVSGNCNSSNTPRACKVTINGMGGARYYMRLKSLYRNSDVSISPGSGQFNNTQAVIDVTGKAQDVLKRLQVRIPLQPSLGSVPEFGLQSANTICKKLEFSSTIPSITDSDNACRVN